MPSTVYSHFGGTLVFGRSYTPSVTLSPDAEYYTISESGTITEGGKTITVPSSTVRYYVNSHYINSNSLGGYTENSYHIADHGSSETVSGSTDSISTTFTHGTDYNNLEVDLGQWFLPFGASLDDNKYYEIVIYQDSPIVSGGSFAQRQSYCEINQGGINERFDCFSARHYVVKGSDIHSENMNSSGWGLFGTVHMFISNTTSSVSISYTSYCQVYEISKKAYEQNAGTPTHDSGTQTQLEESNETQKDTNNKITDFFNGFFDNLIHVFVPEDGFFSDWFSDLNDFMSEKLGFLWSPFDFMLSFLNGVYNGSGNASIVFPELAWIDGTVIIPRTEFSFDNIGGESFQDLRDMIYFATDVILLGAVISQFYKKIKLVFEGGGD